MTSRSSRSGREAAAKRRGSSPSTANARTLGRQHGNTAKQGKSSTSSTKRNHNQRPQTTENKHPSGRTHQLDVSGANRSSRATAPSKSTRDQAAQTQHPSVSQTSHYAADETGTNRAEIPIPVLYEDNHVIGVVKPVNIPSQADATGDVDMLALIKQALKQRYQKEGNVFLGLVHRLDRPVGGAMLFAKTSKGASRLSDSVRSGKLGKRYVAVLRGIPARAQATLRHTLLKNSRTNTSAVVPAGTAGGKDAVLDYELLAVDQQANLSLVLIQLHTGRSHQIRVQMAATGHPLFGDQRYGVNVNRPGEQLALWSVLASAPHPVKDERVRIVSLPPRLQPWTQWSEKLYEQLAQRLDREQE